MEDDKIQTYPTMEDFYDGKTVALTGGTGFLGQGLIEKLLRCCPSIKKIILFIREKRNKTPKQRLEDLVKQPAFDAVRNSTPNCVDKLQAVTCNLYEDDLGLSRHDRKLIRNEVNVFIHCAATLKFNEHLKEAFDINVNAPRRIMKLLKTFHNLDAFVHISTAYTNCDHKVIEERIYKQKLHYKDFEATLKCLDHDTITNLTPEFLEKKPNSYVLTKAMAEDAIQEECGNLPVCILRPSMIVGALSKPIPGWVANAYGPTAFMAAYMKGINHNVMGDPNMIADLVPVDFVVNGTLLSAMKTARDFASRRPSIESYGGYLSDSGNSTDLSSTNDDKNSNERCGDSTNLVIKKPAVPVYVINSSTTNPLYYRVIEIGVPGYNELFPSKPILPLGAIYSTRNRYFYRLIIYFKQILPGHIIDIFLKVSGSKLRLSRLNEKVIAGMQVMEFFFLNTLTIESKNTQKSLVDGLSPNDIMTYSIDTAKFNWLSFMKTYVKGCQKYILKEDVSNYSEAKKQLKRAHTIRQTMKVTGKLVLDFLMANVGIQTPVWESNSYNFDKYHQPSREWHTYVKRVCHDHSLATGL